MKSIFLTPFRTAKAIAAASLSSVSPYFYHQRYHKQADKINSRPVVVMACIVALLVSCKKLDTAPTTNNTAAKTKLLTTGTWKLKSVEQQKADGSWTNAVLGTEYTLAFHEDKTVSGTIGNV